MDKRSFLKHASMMAVLTSFGISLESCSEDDPAPSGSSKLTVDLNESPFSNLLSPGGWTLHPSRPILLVNVDDNIRAFSSVCTHQGCDNSWTFSGEFTCTCHGSKFDTMGNVIQGPASRPLTRIAASRTDDILTLG